MKTLNIEGNFMNLQEIFSEVEYFLEFNKQALIDVLAGKVNLGEFGEIGNAKYSEALRRSEALDRFYGSGDMGRLAISEGGPNEAQYYLSEKERCLEILSDLGVK